MRATRRTAVVVLAALAAAGAVGVGAGMTATAGAASQQTINVAIAYPAPPKALLAKFTAQTGIKVNWSYIQWDNLQTKIAAAAQAKTYFADVTDVDWSKVGEYYTTKWFLPLNKYFNPTSLASQYPQLSSFEHAGTLVGMPMDASMLVTTINKADLSKAGISTLPANLAQYQKDLQTIASKGVVAHPLNIPFAAAEGLSTYWYEVTAAMGGQVLNAAYQPQFTSPSSPGYKAMTWMVNAYKSGLVPKANLNYQDYQGFETNMAHNLTASTFSDYGGSVATIYNVPSQSKVVGQVVYAPTPGSTGAAPNLGNPDGIGIPASAKNVPAAVKFIQWMEQPANQAAFAGAAGPSNVIMTFPLPSNVGGLTLLAKSGKVAGVPALANLLIHHARAVFPGGAPPWYPAFSMAVYSNIHSAAAGQETVAQAISAIASQIQTLQGH